MIYEVEVTREGNIWIADVTNLPGAHTDAGNLQTLNNRVQEVIGLVLDSPLGEQFETRLNFIGVDAEFAKAAELGQRRQELLASQQALIAASTAAATKLAKAGWSVRDISGALNLTPGRVGQLVAGTR